MSNDKVPATSHPDDEPLRCSICQSTAHLAYQHRRLVPDHLEYQVSHMVTRWGEEYFVCPFCGRLEGAVLKGHGLVHIIEMETPK